VKGRKPYAMPVVRPFAFWGVAGLARGSVRPCPEAWGCWLLPLDAFSKKQQQNSLQKGTDAEFLVCACCCCFF